MIFFVNVLRKKKLKLPYSEGSLIRSQFSFLFFSFLKIALFTNEIEKKQRKKNAALKYSNGIMSRGSIRQIELKKKIKIK